MAVPVSTPAPKKQDDIDKSLPIIGSLVGGFYGGAGGATAGGAVGGAVGGEAKQFNPVDARIQQQNEDPVTQLKSGQAAAKNLGLENEYSDTLQQALARARKQQTNPPPTGAV